ncbi:MAG: hypothetical protein R3E40_04520 [Rhodocyclaceae bacterium]
MNRFDSAIAAVIPSVKQALLGTSPANLSEADLRRELVACVLGSQVRFETAVSALDKLKTAGLLKCSWWRKIKDEGFEREVYDCLSRGYRFPRARAKQLAGARDALAKKSLTIRLSEGVSPRAMRVDLIDAIPGLGPKQASMFLRNIGWSVELAILDTHVLRFMELKQLLTTAPNNIGSIAGYERAEHIAIKYADSYGEPVGYVDVAIWATMRAAAELHL